MKMNELKDLCAQVEMDLANARSNLATFEAEAATARRWAEMASSNVLRLQNAVNGLNTAIANLTSKENQGRM